MSKVLDGKTSWMKENYVSVNSVNKRKRNRWKIKVFQNAQNSRLKNRSWSWIRDQWSRVTSTQMRTTNELSQGGSRQLPERAWTWTYSGNSSRPFILWSSDKTILWKSARSSKITYEVLRVESSLVCHADRRMKFSDLLMIRFISGPIFFSDVITYQTPFFSRSDSELASVLLLLVVCRQTLSDQPRAAWRITLYDWPRRPTSPPSSDRTSAFYLG